MYKGTVKVKLSAPLKWEDRTITTVDLDFSKVTGAMIVDAEQASSASLTSALKGTNASYCSNLAASISGVPYRALLKLNGDDFDRVWQTVGAWVNKTDPQKFCDQLSAPDEWDSTNPTDPAAQAQATATAEKPGSNK